MYELCYAPDNASLIVRLTLEEMGAPYRTRLIDRSKQEQRSAAYRDLNPRGLIPVLITPGGPIFETAAILLWLSETHGRMGVAPGAKDRGSFLKWLFFLSNGLHADLRLLFYPESFASRDEMDDEYHIRIRARILDSVAVLERLAAKRRGWFNGVEPSILDHYAATCLRWMALYPVGRCGWFDISAFPTLENLAKRLETRNATQRCVIAEGLGNNPFSRPDYPNPPEGSAL